MPTKLKATPKKHSSKLPLYLSLLFVGLFLASLVLIIKPLKSFATPPPTPPAIGAYTSGVYRNLFQEAGYSETDIAAKVNAAWNQIFYGKSTQKLYYPVGTDMAYMYAVDSNDVRSEGQSYGMMIALQLNKKTEFDRIWKWTKTNMQHASGPRAGLFAWHATTNGVKIDLNSAPDGEIWITTALLLASGRWGDGSGIYNYKAEAQAILDAMRNKEATAATTGVYDLFDPTTKLVRFSTENVGIDATTWTDPSYQEPAFYELWAVSADKDNQFWTDAAIAARQFLATTVNPTTGLMPDYANFDGTPHMCCPTGSGNHHNYSYDARRTAMNIGMDYHWFAKDAWQITQSDRFQQFFASKGVTTFGSEYQLNGTLINNNHESGHDAMVASAGLAGSTPAVWDFVNHLWTSPILAGQFRYYDDLLYMLGLLQTSGRFQVYGNGAAPAVTPTPSPTSILPTPTTSTQPGIHVGELSVQVVKAGPQYQGIVTTRIVDQNGTQVSGATVNGTWSGAANDTDSGVTGTTGTIIEYSNKSSSTGPFTYCISSVTKTGLTYDASANSATCVSASF